MDLEVGEMEKDKEIAPLKEQLLTAEHNLQTAAEIGKMLVEENEELKTSMETLQKSQDRKLELAEQETFGLQAKLDQKISMENWYNDEITYLRQQLADVQQNLHLTLDGEHAQEVGRLTRQVDELRADIEGCHNTELHLRQKIGELEDLLNERLNQTDAPVPTSDSVCEEISHLHDEVNTLQLEMTNIKSQLIDKKSDLQSVTLECERLRGKVIARDDELDEIKCQFTSVNNTLEQSRVEKLDLKCQLDALRMETSGHNKKGNSIFSELEDRRIVAEKKLISLKVTIETLKEKFNVEKQQNLKYKRHVSQLLLQMSSGRVDIEHVTRLEAKLSQARQEIRTLLEEKSQQQDSQDGPSKFLCGRGEKDGDEDYVQYLVTLVESKDKELQKLKKDLNFKTFQHLDEKSRTSTMDSKINQIEAEKDKLRSQNMNLALRLEEMRLKYDPDSVKKSGILVVKKTEKIPLDDTAEITITETRRPHDSSTINQSQTSFHTNLSTRTLTETSNNVKQNPPIALRKCLKVKTVSISDDVQEHEVTCENSEESLNNDGAFSDKSSTETRQKGGRRVTAVKHISAASTTSRDVNQCKNQ